LIRVGDEGIVPAAPWAVVGPAGTKNRVGAAGAVAARAHRTLLAVCVLSGSALVVDALILEPNWIEVARTLEYAPALRASAPDLTLVHLSDIHVARVGYRERRAIEIVNAARPDLILVSGDLARGRGSMPAVASFLGALRARHGTFVVWGNHDYQDGVVQASAEAALERAGVRLLKNSSAFIRHPIGRVHVAGVDDPVTGHDNLAQAMRRVPRRDFCILLSHSPEIVRSPGNWDIDMVLAGHTHGGQVRLPLIGVLWTPAGTRGLMEGWFDVDRDVRLHVSRGLGWSVLPIRFLCRPRIDRITVRGGLPPGRGAPKAVTRRS
jgi:hypothetical protein